MRKSSLGRRSSTNIPTRIPSLGASGTRRCSTEKRPGSLLRQPGFSQSKRSQSEDRDSYGGRPSTTTIMRSSSANRLAGRGLGAMTPVTPRQSLHANLPTGTARPLRAQTMSTDSNRRMSSFGGTKSSRKDTRPITEKSFQQLAQTKVQQYLIEHCPNILGPGNSIRPMHTKLFVDLMDHLLKYFDTRIVITKSNYLEELPIVLKKFGYRSKIDRSWLMTVNTPHSWQHVVAVLSWLVDIIECMDTVDEFDMMYTNNLSDPSEDNDNEEEDDLKIDKNLVLHLKKTYRFQNDPNLVDQMDTEFIDKMIIDARCTDEDQAVLQREIELVNAEVQNEQEIRDQELKVLEKMKAKHNAVSNDVQSVQAFIEESKAFIRSTEEKIAALSQEIVNLKISLGKKEEAVQNLKVKVDSQEISLEDKAKLMKDKVDLLRMIQFYEDAIRDFDNSAFAVDINLAESQRKLEKLILEYNKLVTEKIIVEPRLKDVEVKFTLLNKADKEVMDMVNENLKSLKEEYKNSIKCLKAEQEETESVLWKLKKEIKETEEEIAKETTLLEGVECDLEKQEELISKFERDGFVVIEDFLTEKETDELKLAGEKLASAIPKESLKCVFSTTQVQQSKDLYFLESADKISYFFEAGALNEDGELLVDESVSLNKVGHALHWLHPTFRRITFCERSKEACYQLGMEDPVVVQSMYIYKNPGIGSEVIPHQDATFLYTEPMTTVGFWIALEDATIQNGCLWFASGSHKSDVHRRFKRNPDPDSTELLVYDSPAPIYPNSSFRPVPVSKGTCILIHGQVVHRSDHNRSSKSRHAYTFHVMDAKRSTYSKDNWLQTSEGFKSMYKNY